MVASASGDSFEQMIGQWRTYVRHWPIICSNESPLADATIARQCPGRAGAIPYAIGEDVPAQIVRSVASTSCHWRR